MTKTPSYFDLYDEFGEPVSLLPANLCPVGSDREVGDRLAIQAQDILDAEEEFEARMEREGHRRGPPAHWFKENGGWL